MEHKSRGRIKGVTDAVEPGILFTRGAICLQKKRRNTDSQVAQVGGMNNQKEICTNKLLKKMKETYKSTTDNFKGRPAFILTEPP